jgi:hypothetical protein
MPSSPGKPRRAQNPIFTPAKDRMKMLRSGITAWQSPDTFDLDQDSVPYNASPTALSKPNLYCSLCALSKYYIPKPQSNMYMLAHAVSLEEMSTNSKVTDGKHGSSWRFSCYYAVCV